MEDKQNHNKMSMNYCNNEFVVFGDLPGIDNLSWLIMRVNADGQQQLPASSDYGNNFSPNGISSEQVYTLIIWKCRELLFLEDMVLAAPSPSNNVIDIVVPSDLLQDETFLHLLDRLTLKIFRTADYLDESVFKRCLSYTIVAKLAPLWNIVGDYLVKDRDFLSRKSKSQAIHMEVNINKSKLYLVLTFANLKLPSMTLHDLGISSNVLANFNRDHFFRIDGTHLQTSSCIVLPSLKKGVIQSVTHEIPHNSSIKNFDELKSYWKNSYGYRLPEKEENSVYFNLRFWGMNNIIYTYPATCVLPSKPMATPQTRELMHESHLQFRTDILHRIPLICGFQWLKSETPDPLMHLAVELNPAADQSQTLNSHLNTEQVMMAASELSSDTPMVSSSQCDIDVAAARRIIPRLHQNNHIRRSMMPTSSQLASSTTLTDDEVMSFCKKRQLNKVKLELLVNWAKKKGILHYSRMKTSEFLDRITKFVLMNTVEP